ncbi:hypothetical protein LINGRAHAP2_LOCUS17435, partial [Linum grandiflorum]
MAVRLQRYPVRTGTTRMIKEPKTRCAPKKPSRLATRLVT